MKLTRILIYLLILIFPLGQLTRFSLIRPEIIIYLHDLIIIFILFLNIKKLPNFLQKNKYLSLFLFYCLVILIFQINSLGLIEVLISSLYLFRFIAYLLLFLILKNTKLPQFKKYFFISYLLALLFSFIQYFLIPSFEFLFPLGWDRHNGRLAGTWLDPNFAGIILVIYFFYFLKNQFLKSKYLNIFLIFINLLAILLTYSRATYLSFIIALIFYFIKKEKTKIALTIPIILLIALFFLPQKFGEGTKLLRTSTIFARFNNLDQAQNLIIQKPIFGHGFNTLRYVKKNQKLSDYKWQISHSVSGLDNSLLFLLATTGIIGTIFYFLTIKNLIGKTNLFTQTILIAIFISGMFSNVWFYPWIILISIFMFSYSKKL